MRYRIEGTDGEKCEWLENVIDEADYEAVGEVGIDKKQQSNDRINKRLEEVILDKKLLYQRSLSTNWPRRPKSIARNAAKHEIWLKVYEEVDK